MVIEQVQCLCCGIAYKRDEFRADCQNMINPHKCEEQQIVDWHNSEKYYDLLNNHPEFFVPPIAYLSVKRMMDMEKK